MRSRLVGKLSLQHSWIQAGIAALVAFALLVFVSIRYVRKKAYEVFFLLHQVLVL
jgi:hypothetical protein